MHQESGPDATWSRVNTAESIVGVQTPLSWSFWDVGGETGFRRAYVRLGLLPRTALEIPEAVDQQFTAIFYGHAASNITAFREAMGALPGSATDAAEQSFFSSQHRVGRSTGRGRRLAVATWLPWVALMLPRRLTRLRARSRAFWHASLAHLVGDDVAGAHECLRQALERFGSEVAAQIEASTIASLCHAWLNSPLERAGLPELENALLGGYGELEEVQVSADLWEISRKRAELSAFLERHGFRGPAEGELSEPSWREDPAPAISLASSFERLGDEKSPREAQRRRAHEREQAERRLLGALAPLARLRARAILFLARRYVPQRVVAKAAFMQTFDVARAAARVIGVELVRSGVLERPEDVFYLTLEELEEPPHEAREWVAFRRDRRETYQQLDVPLSFQGTPVVTPRGDASPAADAELRIQALGVSSGQVEGRARVVTDPARDAFEPREILVCHTTDPSWTSYMLLAAAAVIDIGGPLSHGAIVARELGIPCVINSVDGTRRLQTGDRVHVDGDAGTVTRLPA